MRTVDAAAADNKRCPNRVEFGNSVERRAERARSRLAALRVPWIDQRMHTAQLCNFRDTFVVQSVVKGRRTGKTHWRNAVLGCNSR
jgi:hypothetical protein